MMLRNKNATDISETSEEAGASFLMVDCHSDPKKRQTHL
jgi:hypothetical protein